MYYFKILYKKKYSVLFEHLFFYLFMFLKYNVCGLNLIRISGRDKIRRINRNWLSDGQTLIEGSPRDLSKRLAESKVTKCLTNWKQCPCSRAVLIWSKKRERICIEKWDTSVQRRVVEEPSCALLQASPSRFFAVMDAPRVGVYLIPSLPFRRSVYYSLSSRLPEHKCNSDTAISCWSHRRPTNERMPFLFLCLSFSSGWRHSSPA